MQVSVETTSGLERRLTIVVPSAEFEGEVTERLAATQKRTRLPGFRPGKVPMKEVRRRFGAGALAETASDIMRMSFTQALQQQALAPVGSPTLEIVKLAPGDDFEFTATFEVLPVVELMDFTTLEIAKPVGEITDADIDDMVQRLREQRRKWETVDRGAEEGDLITVDFEGKIEGESFEGNKGEGVDFEVGAGRMIEDFDQAVRGMAAGDNKDFPGTFPEDNPNERLAGKTVEFTVNVRSVRAPKLPEVDEAFFADFGVEEGGMEAFRQEVTGNMRRELDTAIRAQVKGQVMGKLLKHHEVQLPHALVNQEIQGLKDRMQERVRPAGRKTVTLSDDLFRERAEEQASLTLIIREIVRSRGLSVDGERVRRRVEELAEPYTDSDRMVAWYYQDEKRLAGVEMAVLEDQVIDVVLDEAQVSLQESSYGDIIAGNLSADDDAEESEDEGEGEDKNTSEGEDEDDAGEYPA